MIEEKAEHESFGMVGISRYTGGHETLFGSSIKHRNGIALRIHTASLRRDLAKDWYYAERCIVEVHLSQSQFAELITTPNVGSGVPCTIKYLNGTVMENPPFESKADTFRDEFRADAKKIADEASLYMKEALDILKNKASIGKGDREVILDAFKMLIQDVKDNLPFLQKQFHEQMDKTIVEAKSEIESFVEHKIRAVGLEAIRDQVPQLPE